MKKFWIVFILVALFIGGGFGLLWFSISNLDESVSIDGGVLVWEMGGNYPEERDDSFWGQIRSGGEMTMPEVLFALYRAAEDDRITGLMLDMRGVALLRFAVCCRAGALHHRVTDGQRDDPPGR